MKDKKILKVFDFDGTLFDTLDVDSGKERYKEVMGVEYPHIGWWGREESLVPELDLKPIGVVRDEYDIWYENQPDNIYLMTGRLKHLKPHVINMLKKHGYEFTDVFCNDIKGTTEEFKISKLSELIDSNEFDEIHFYDDREKHFDIFMDYFLSKKIPFFFHQVVNENGEFKINTYVEDFQK